MIEERTQQVNDAEQEALDSLVAEAVAAQTERCAKIAEKMGVWQIAAAIRETLKSERAR